jgi:hypothetical protein
MKSKRCKYSNKCPVYGGSLYGEDKPGFMLRNIFCTRGEVGWTSCKRFEIYKQDAEPPDKLLP